MKWFVARTILVFLRGPRRAAPKSMLRAPRLAPALSISQRRLLCSSSALALNARSVAANGVQLHCVTSGSSGTPVLCMPGALGTAMTDFEPQLTGLAAHHQVVSFDPRGYGQSRPPDRDFPDGFYRRDADDGAALMAALGHSSYHVVGWSDGAIAAAILTADQPAEVKSLVMFGGNAYFTEEDGVAFDKYRNIEESWSKRMLATHRPVYGDKLQPMWDACTDAWLRILSDKGGDVCMTEAKAIACPTYVMHGAKDPICLSDHPKWFHANIAGSRLHEFPDGKHNIHIKFAAEFNAMCLEFWREVDGQ